MKLFPSYSLVLISKVVDLSNHSWVYPTFLVPLWNLFNNNELEYKQPRNHTVDNYIDTVMSTEYSKGSTLSHYNVYVKAGE